MPRSIMVAAHRWRRSWRVEAALAGAAARNDAIDLWSMVSRGESGSFIATKSRKSMMDVAG